MHIQVNTDNTIQGREDVISYVEGVVNSKLGAISSHLTRVEVHVADENAHKGGVDKRCTVEARPKGRAPLAASHTGATIQNAVTGAVDKLRAALDSELGKLGKHR